MTALPLQVPADSTEEGGAEPKSDPWVDVLLVVVAVIAAVLIVRAARAGGFYGTGYR